MPQKNITIITGNFYPEDTAIGLYTTQFAKHLAQKGHQVKVITGFPNYPQWKIHESYKHLPNYCSEIIDGIKIIRYKQYIPSKVTFKGRILMMLSLFYGTCINLRKVKETDLVICIVPFTISILPAFILSKLKKAKLWIHIQDFEFDLALESGILKKNNFITNGIKKVVTSFESKLLNVSNIVSSISFNMLQKIKTKSNHISPYFFPNWVSAKNINPEKSLNHNYINPDKFTLLYSGNIGEKQDWLFLENLCTIITDKDIEVIIVGDGAFRNKLSEIIKKFDFVKLYNPIPYLELNNLLCSANIHFLFQKQEVVDTVMPSKTLGMMASSKPSIIVGNINSEVKTIIEQSEGGLYFSDYNVNKIYESILNLKKNPNICLEMGVKSRKFILDNFSEEVILNNFSNKIKEYLV